VNYYVYTSDGGHEYAVRATLDIALVMYMVHAYPRLTRWNERWTHTRKLRLAEFVDGREILITDPSTTFTYDLGELVPFRGDIYYVVAQLPETAVAEKP
jgi:hypothetical protein